MDGAARCEVEVFHLMNSSFDAQRNEFCAYVLSEDETPFGLTLGNFKTFASSTPKGGVRGLWDANTDQIIFGTHQIAYRLRDRGYTLFPREIKREFTFLPYAQISEFALDERVRVTECFYVPHGPRHDRTVAFVVDVTLHNRAAESAEVAVFPWALIVGQRFYGEPEKEVHASIAGDYIRVLNQETGATRWWGGSRKPYVVVVGLREQIFLHAMARGALREEGDGRGDAGARRVRRGPHLRRARVSRDRRARRTRNDSARDRARSQEFGRSARELRRPHRRSARRYTTRSAITATRFAKRGS